MRELVGVKPEGFDLDDTIFKRERIIRYFEAVKRKLGISLPKLTFEGLPKVDHTPVDVPLKGWKEFLAFDFHRTRGAIPGVAERLKEKASQGIPLYGISGRPATQVWAYMTIVQLDHARIPLADLLLTPRGTSGLISKAHGIKLTGVCEYSDDDPDTVFYLARLFPQVQFNYIHYGLTPKPRGSNIRVVTIKQWSDPNFR